ncbi:MAG: IMP dehydrogenase, partial [Clostridia bacterium]|nr:IMP dehydrogenase [Clostridia bacterium]
MATFIQEPSHTFNEYLLIPGYSSSECVPANVSLKTPLVKFRRGEASAITMNIPMVSAIMQSVSGDRLAVALATEGGVAFIYGSQSVEDEAAMVSRAKSYKAGFVTSDSNIRADDTLADVIALTERTGHSTIAVTEDGTANGKLLGIVTSRDYRVSRMALDTPVNTFMTPFDKLIWAREGTTLKEANDIIWDNKLNSLPIISEEGNLRYMVFRKDYDSHKQNPNELLDRHKRYVVGAGINTRDYEQRVPALLEAGADVLCIDSSEGFSEWQKRTISWIRQKYGDDVKVGAGNVVDAEGFRFLAECGADFVKVGIGGGSICITRETKGIGRGQATALIEVCAARDKYFEETGVYIPVCSDGGIVYDHHITLALAMGADFVMLGRYFARFDESPSNKVSISGTYYKEYWGEGSARARNWQRYDLGGDKKLSFEEGVDSYVPYAGSLKDNVALSLSKVRSTMCNCGALTIPELQKKAK